MMTTDTFDILLLIARPAAGKSEIIDYFKNMEISERISRFHIGDFEEIDDFPMLWAWFEEDWILEEMGYPRLHTDSDEYFIGNHLWDLLIERICLEYRKKVRSNVDNHKEKTVILEFARGTEHGGFARAFRHLSPEVITKLAILYINVSWEESLRKNRRRFNPERPDSILEHGIPDRKLEGLYRHNDWDEITVDDPETIAIQGVKVPYAVFENEDDLTTQGGEALGERLEQTLGRLFGLYSRVSQSR
jgi:hypothetical protein